MNLNDIDAVPSYDPAYNIKKIGDCGTCNADVFDSYTKCTKCGDLICEDCTQEGDYCRKCEIDYQDKEELRDK